MDVQLNTACHSDAQINLLCKYKDMFPASFVECIRQGVSWLCNHNNITYQSALAFRSDAFIYETSGSGLLQLGVIDTEKPLGGLNYYDIVKIEESKDSITGNIVFKVKLKYTTPLGLNAVLVPIKYFIPNEKKVDTYTAAEVDTLLCNLEAKLTKLIPNVEDFVKTEDLTPVITNLQIDIKELESKLNSISSGSSGGLTDEFIDNLKSQIELLHSDIDAAELATAKVDTRLAKLEESNKGDVHNISLLIDMVFPMDAKVKEHDTTLTELKEAMDKKLDKDEIIQSGSREEAGS